MRILVLNYEYPPLGGGAAPVCRDLAVRMSALGHQVTVVTMGYHDLPSHERKDGVEVYRVRCLRTRAHACLPWEQYTYIRSSRRFLKKHMLDHTYDVCHAHFIVPTGPVARWLKRQYGIPYVLTAHGSDVEGYNKKCYLRVMHRVLRPFWRQIVREASGVAAPSAYMLRLMQQEMRDGPYVQIPNGLDLDRYHPVQFTKGKSILVMSRLQKFKNVQVVLRAVSLIRETDWNDWHVDILGDGPYRRELEAMCRTLAIEKRIQFRGWVEHGSVEQLQYLSRAAVYVSASSFENCPMTVLEALAAGCYPLLSDIEGHRQFFSPDAERYFFRTDDAEALAERMIPVLQSDVLSLCMEKTDLSGYSIQHSTEQYMALLTRACQQGRSRRDETVQ